MPKRTPYGTLALAGFLSAATIHCSKPAVLVAGPWILIGFTRIVGDHHMALTFDNAGLAISIALWRPLALDLFFRDLDSELSAVVRIGWELWGEPCRPKYELLQCTLRAHVQLGWKTAGSRPFAL